jgi:hypothetical protein
MGSGAREANSLDSTPEDGVVSRDVLLIFGLVLTVLVWILEEARRRLGERFADWLFPNERPTTYRLARCIVRLAGAIGSRPVRKFDSRDGIWQFLDPDEAWAGAGLALADRWDAPEEALAELDCDQAGKRVTDPVRLVLPLLRLSLQRRLLSGWAYLQVSAWCVFLAAPLRAVIFSVRLVDRVRTRAKRVAAHGQEPSS